MLLHPFGHNVEESVHVIHPGQPIGILLDPVCLGVQLFHRPRAIFEMIGCQGVVQTENLLSRNRLEAVLETNCVHLLSLSLKHNIFNNKSQIDSIEHSDNICSI